MFGKISKAQIIIVAGATLEVSIPVWQDILKSKIADMSSWIATIILILLSLLIIASIGALVYSQTMKSSPKTSASQKHSVNKAKVHKRTPNYKRKSNRRHKT
jgi:hypothetical protein